ncbi:MAG: hypothetical protein K6F51_14405 [Acetatifactor sp.]|nr:hypothetical protein [Acetatifactor sp.]
MIYYSEMAKYYQGTDDEPASIITNSETLPHPCNCKTECPYGYGKAFCFPCMAKIMSEHNAARKHSAAKA